MFMLEEGDGTGRKDEKDAEDDVLDEAALGAGNLGTVHRQKRANIPGLSLEGRSWIYLNV
jgi:hypothetical protein